MRIYYVLSETDEEFDRRSPLFSSLEKAQEWVKENKSSLLSVAPHYYCKITIVSEVLDGDRYYTTRRVCININACTGKVRLASFLN